MVGWSSYCGGLTPSLLTWTRRDVWQYMQAHNIPELPLYAQGYTSIGCPPCTALPLNPDDARSGRWQGKQKLEAPAASVR